MTQWGPGFEEIFARGHRRVSGLHAYWHQLRAWRLKKRQRECVLAQVWDATVARCKEAAGRGEGSV